MPPGFKNGQRSGFLPLLSLVLLLCISPYPGLSDSKTAVDSNQTILEWDYGFLPQKSVVSHLFYLHNTNSNSIKVTKVKAGCSCTSVSPIDEPIAPGDSVGVEVTFKSGRYFGEVRKTTKVYVDNGEEPAFLLRIRAEVFKNNESAGTVTLEPPRLKLERKESDSAELTISNHGEDTLAVMAVYIPVKLADAIQLPQQIAPGENGEITLKLKNREQGAGSKALSLTLDLSGSDKCRITIPVEIE